VPAEFAKIAKGSFLSPTSRLKLWALIWQFS